MSQIPENEVTQDDMEAWFKAKKALEKVKAQEILLRNKIFKGKFPNPREGTNNLDIGDGYFLKATHVINRSVDDAAFKASIEEFAKAGIPTDQIVRYKPELATGKYRGLTEEQRHLMDTVLIIKDGTPGLEITQPKRAPKV